ncbi:IS481 family transposase [Phycicoccus endophyticus]|uniref:IS481 family transposase n=2 Tax=Phycicoccus endophyticus TaxID=1690220 RepID=A0A7G9R034_9MICO|nr:IS481 family transposase [Phycicoccus endophyticus]
MSKAPLVITAVVQQHRSVAEVAASYGVSRSWAYELVARYRVEGEAAFEPRSRRPRTSPRAVPAEVVEAVLAQRDRLTTSGHDAGPETIAWHVEQAGVHAPSRATIARVLTRHGRVVPAPKKKPKAAYRRFAAEQPNECWQSDFTHVTLADGTGVEVITWLDDHSRMVLHLSARPRITGQVVLDTFRATVAEHGCPAATLTDNGMVYTVRHSAIGVRGGRNAFEHELAVLGVVQKNGRGNHPQTQGKVERFQQTLKTWLTRQGPPPETITDLQALLNRFRVEYNHHRPHRSLHRRTPAAAYTARPKTGPPSEPADRTHTRVRHDKVNNGKITLRHAGTLYSIGLGRHLNGRAVTALVHGLDITVIDITTGELIRQLTLDTTRRYQPQNQGLPEP